MRHFDRPFVLRGAASVVLLGMVLAYYVTHPLLPEPLLQTLFPRIKDLLIGLLILALAGSLGTPIAPDLAAPKLARFALRGGLGLGLISLAVFLLGSFVGLAPAIYWLLMGIGAVTLRKHLGVWLEDLGELGRIWHNSDWVLKWILILISLLFSLAMFKALLPPLKYDVLVYHLTLPEIYLNQGQIGYVRGNLHWGFPQLPHMLYTLALTLGAERAALIGWLMGLLAVLGLAGYLTDRLEDDTAGWVAPSALLAGTSLADSLAWGYVDWPSILFGWMLIFSLDMYLSQRNRVWLLMSATGTGFAFGSKYSAGLLILLALILLWRKGNLRELGSFALLCSLLILPWLLRNWLFTDNPIYPMLFEGGEVDAFRLQAMQGLPAQGNWLDFVLLPLRATFLGAEGMRLGTAPGYEASIGPLLLAFGFFAWLARGKRTPQARQTLAGLTFIAVSTLLVWALGARLTGHLARTHLYYFAFPAFAGLAAFGYANLRDYLGIKFVPYLVVLVLAASTLSVALSGIQTKFPSTFFDRRSEIAYLEHNLGLYALVTEYISEELPIEARVLMLWEARAFYCTEQCDPDDILDHWRDAQYRRQPGQSFESYWIDEGYSHLLYHAAAAQFIAADPEHFLPLNLSQLEGALAELTLLEDFNGAYQLYALQP